MSSSAPTSTPAPTIQDPLAHYLASHQAGGINPTFLAYLSNLSLVAKVQPEVVQSIIAELKAQRASLKLIASENYSSIATQLSMGNLLTDKYAEGFPFHRFYAGCQNIDRIESLAAEHAREIFGADHAFVQPHCGSDANLIAYLAILSLHVQAPILRAIAKKAKPDTPDAELKLPQLSALPDADWAELRRQCGNQRLLALDYYSGGHLTHGYRANLSGLLFEVTSYGVSRETGVLDYDEIERLAEQVRPLILLAGYSAYPRKIDFARMRAIADKVGAVLMVDLAHFAGLVAGGVFTDEFNPIPYADIATSTTHKTLRGPRGGVVLCKKRFAEYVDKACPLAMGGPLPNMIAAKAVAFAECKTPAFREYARQIVLNSQALAAACIAKGAVVLTGGTDNHMLLIDVRPYGINGRQAEEALRACGLTMNRNALPFDTEGPWFTSGIRLGTPAVTTLGMREAEMSEIAAIVVDILSHTHPAPGSRAKWVMDEGAMAAVRPRVEALLARFPVYPELDLPLLETYFGQPPAAPSK